MYEIDIDVPVALENIFQGAKDLAINKKRNGVDIDILFHSFLFLYPTFGTRYILINSTIDYELLGNISVDVINSKKAHKKTSPYFNDECNSLFQTAIRIGAAMFHTGDHLCPDSLFLAFVKKHVPKALKLYWEEKGQNNKQLVSRLLSHCRHLDADDSIFYLSKITGEEHIDNEKDTLDMFCDNPILSKFAINLNIQAANKKFDNLIDFDNKVNELCSILCRKKKPNAVLIGNAGTGKTQTVNLLAQSIVNGEAPELLTNKVIYSLSLSSMVAGTEYRGQFEKRLEEFVNEIKKYDNIILFIDEIHTLVGAGGVSSTSLEASNMLKPALANGEISCIGATTPTEYNLTIKKDAALDRRFEKVLIKDPSGYKMKQIIPRICENYGVFHNVRYSKEFMDNIIDYCDSFYPKRHYPDKAVDVIDQCGADAKIKFWEFSEEEDKYRKIFIESSECGDIKQNDIDRMQEGIEKWGRRVLSESPIVTVEHLKKLFINKINPIFSILENDFNIIENEICCQKNALNLFRETVLDCSFLDDSNKSILLYGPKNSGKSFFIKKISSLLSRGGGVVCNYNGAEFSQNNSTLKIQGLHQDSLCEKVILFPNSIIIIDDINEANYACVSLFSQILKDQKIQMLNGEVADFSNCFFIFTSSQKPSDKIGYSKQVESIPDVDSLLKSSLGQIIPLKPLDKSDYVNIVNSRLIEIKSSLEKKGCKFNFSSSDVEKIAETLDFKAIDVNILKLVKIQNRAEKIHEK